MKKEVSDPKGDIAEIRHMMSRSSRYLSLSGISGVMAGLYAVVGAYVAHSTLQFRPAFSLTETMISDPHSLMQLAISVLAMAIGTALLLSHLNSKKRGERSWNATTRRMLIQMAIPLASGGLLTIGLIPYGFWSLSPLLTLLFYGISLVSASPFTYSELRILGILQIVLGLLCLIRIDLSLLFWSIGFGILHIVYGMYIHLKYQR